jgi:dynein heavy chain, axonemal
MRNEWKLICFELVSYKNSDTYVLSTVDPIMDKLDEDISKTTSIASSPFIKFMESEVLKWRSNLLQVQEIIEMWVQLQKNW